MCRRTFAEWVTPDLSAAIGRRELVSHTKQQAERVAARIKVCLAQAQLSAHDIDAMFLTGGSVKLAHVRKAIIEAVPSAGIVEGDTFGAASLLRRSEGAGRGTEISIVCRIRR